MQVQPGVASVVAEAHAAAVFVRGQFNQFYDTMFERQANEQGGDAVFLEYAWNIGGMMCDPCSSTPLSLEELKELGAHWIQTSQQPWMTPGPAFLTRLHVLYDKQHFPEDLQLQETPDTQSFQARYVMHRPFKGDLSCPAGDTYKETLRRRLTQEADTLAKLTGWLPSVIANSMQASGEVPR